MSLRPVLATLAIGAVAVLVTVGVLRIVVGGGRSASPDAILPFLLAGAALCVVGLTGRRHPTTASLALIMALAILTVDLATFAREQRAVASDDLWRWLSIAIVLSAIATTGSAAAYAADPAHRLGRWVIPTGAIAVGVLFAIGVWAVATPDPSPNATTTASPLGDLGLVTRTFLITTVALTSLGLLGDLRPATRRATARLSLTPTTSARPGDRLRHAGRWILTVADELTPGRAQERRAAMSERARIARDLHATVVPDLRRAIRDSEQVEPVGRLPGSLRDALLQVEAMMESRDTIGLEIGGLIPALESLAERIEDRSTVRVAIDVLDDPSQPAGSPPREVAMAALRVASLALDNVTRHAPTAAVRVTVMTGPEHVALSIEDDGSGGASHGSAREAPVAHGRGLADMATEASLCGASLRATRGDGGIGTVIVFDWPAD